MYLLMLIGSPKAQASRAWKHVLQNPHHVACSDLTFPHKYLLRASARDSHRSRGIFWLTWHGSCVNSLGYMNQKATDTADRSGRTSSAEHTGNQLKHLFSFYCSLEAKAWQWWQIPPIHLLLWVEKTLLPATTDWNSLSHAYLGGIPKKEIF